MTTPKKRPAEAQDQELDELWQSLRQGAANVAGVTYQLALTALVLVEPILGKVVVEATPEGFEDIDCRFSDGQRVFIQAKERTKGDATLGVSAIKTAIEHASGFLTKDSAASFALIADARLPASIKSGEPLTGNEGLKDVDADLLARSFVLRMEWHSVSSTAETAILRDYEVEGVVASLTLDRLFRQISQAASEQRFTAYGTAIKQTRSSVDLIVNEIAAAIDLDALTEAERAGVISSVDFSRPLDTDGEPYLWGIDAQPGHIAAGLDFLRVGELKKVFEYLDEDRFALISGASGAGKSTLLWRAAYELAGAFSLVRLRRINAEQLQVLERYLRFRSPTESRPLLVCVDDLGRPSIGDWNEAVDLMMEMPNVFVLASSRNEDLSTDMRRGRARPLEPELDHQLAEEIALQARARDIPLAMEVDEALDMAEGLLMEFIGLLLRGDRLKDVVSAQVQDRKDKGLALEIEVLRYVTCAHQLGASIEPESLEALLGQSLTASPALGRLRSEFLVLEDESGSWTGLHELRSSHVTQSIHEDPPPALPATVSRIVEVLDPPTVIDRILLNAARSTIDLAPAAAVLKHRISSRSARDASSCVGGLLNVDGFIYARDCLIWLEEQDLDIPEDALIISFAARYVDPKIGNGMPPPIKRTAEELPPMRPSLAREASDGIDPMRLVELAGSSPIGDVLELCEALAASAWPRECSTEEGAEILAQFQSSTDLPAWTKLLSAVTAIMAPDSPPALAAINERIDQLASHFRDVIRVEVSGRKGQISVFDLGKGKQRHVEILEVAYRLLPEIDTIRMVTVAVDSKVSSRPDAISEIRRESIVHPLEGRRRLQGFKRGLDLNSVADDWSERLRKQELASAKLRSLFEQVPQRLLDRNDNSRRREDWKTSAAETAELVGSLPAPPVPMAEVTSQVRDVAKQVLNALSTALLQLANELEDLEQHRLVGIGSQIRAAIADLEHSRSDDHLAEWPIAERLRQEVEAVEAASIQAADLLLALSENPDLVVRKDGRKWTEAGQEVVASAREFVESRDRALLEETLSKIPHDLVALPTDAPVNHRLSENHWLIVVDVGDWADLVLRAIPEMGEQARQLLSHRTWALPALDDTLVPINGIVIGTQETFPLELSVAERIAEVSGRDYVSGPKLSRTVGTIQLLVEADRNAAFARLRGEEFDNAPELAAAESSLDEARQSVASLEIPDVMNQAFEMLLGFVEAQRTSAPPVSISLGEDQLAKTGFMNTDALMNDVLITGTIQLSIESGEIVSPA